MVNVDKFQLLMDAKTLGMISRNVAALANPTDFVTRSRISRIRGLILARHGAKTVNECLLKIAAEMRKIA
jgi:hypothetical protein